MFRKRVFNFIFFMVVAQHFQNSLAVPSTNEIQPGQPRPTKHGLSKYDDSGCGGALEAGEEVQTLSYRMERPKDQYESCVWTIHALNGGTVKINITSPLAPGLAVGFFLDSSYDQAESFKWELIPLTTDSQFIEVPAPVAFLHYLMEDTTPQFGFQLTYQAGETVISALKYRNYFFEGNHGIFAYPPEGEENRNNERITVVLKVYPSAAAQTHINPSWVQYLHNGHHGSGSCAEENLNLFGYEEREKEWVKNATQCESGHGMRSWVSTLRNDPLIFTFNSGATGPVGRFEIRWLDNYYQ